MNADQLLSYCTTLVIVCGFLATMCLIDLNFTAEHPVEGAMDFPGMVKNALVGHTYAILYLLCVAIAFAAFSLAAFIRFSFIF